MHPYINHKNILEDLKVHEVFQMTFLRKMAQKDLDVLKIEWIRSLPSLLGDIFLAIPMDEHPTNYN